MRVDGGEPRPRHAAPVTVKAPEAEDTISVKSWLEGGAKSPKRIQKIR